MFKKYKLMFSYIKTIKEVLPKINEYFKINEQMYPFTFTELKLDNIYRIYTVVNFPPNTVKTTQTYGHLYLDNETNKFLKVLNDELKKYGLFELIGLVKADRIGENNVLIVIEYRLLNIGKIYRNLIIGALGLTSLLGLYLFL